MDWYLVESCLRVRKAAADPRANVHGPARSSAYCTAAEALNVALVASWLGSGNAVLDSLKLMDMGTWSWKLDPTDGVSFLTVILAAVRTSRGPIPLSISK